jgi:hypothetical protein
MTVFVKSSPQRKPPAKRLYNGMTGGSAFARVNDEPLAVQQAPQQQVPCSVASCANTYLVPVGEEVAPNFKYVCPEHAKKNKIDPEVRKMIKDSLASTPNSIPDSRNTMRVQGDSNIGTRSVTVKPGDDPELSLEDAAEAIRRGQGSKKTPDALITSTAPTKRSFPGQKSEAFAAIFNSSNPDAPWGYDESGNPIVPARTDQQIATDLLEKSFLKPGNCPHKRDPQYCILCGVSEYKPLQGVEDTPEAMLQRVMQMFQTYGKFSVGQQIKDKFMYWPEILGVTRGTLLLLLDTPCGEEPQTEQRRVLKSQEPHKKLIADLQNSLAKIPKRIQKYKDLIKLSEDRIHSWGKKVMQGSGVSARAPEDIPEDKIRRSWIRKEEKRIERCEQAIREQQKRLRGTTLADMKEHLTKWGERDDDWEFISCVIPPRIVYFREQFKAPGEVRATNAERASMFYKPVIREIRDQSDAYAQLRERGNTITECYISLFSTQYEALQGFSRRFREMPSIDAWSRFENAVLLQAIGYGILDFTVSDPTLQLKLGSAVTVAMPSGKFDPVEIDDAPLHSLILKTGGGEIGASIYAFGGKRTSGDFDNTIAYGNKDKREYDAPVSESFVGGMDSGDCGERGGDE